MEEELGHVSMYYRFMKSVHGRDEFQINVESLVKN